jgi:hypothetical protein
MYYYIYAEADNSMIRNEQCKAEGRERELASVLRRVKVYDDDDDDVYLDKLQTRGIKKSLLYM